MPLQSPKKIWIVRHGESAGNVARDLADGAGHSRIEIADRDVDVPLSELGMRQSEALAQWFADQAQSERPNVILASPYRRAVQTANIIAEKVNPDDSLEIIRDERLREKEFGILDRLTRHGIEELHPEQAEFQAHSWEVLPPPARRRRKLVRRHPPIEKRPRHDQPSSFGEARADCRSPGRGAVPTLYF